MVGYNEITQNLRRIELTFSYPFSITQLFNKLNTDVQGRISRPSDGCPEGTDGCDSQGCPNTCFCADHCSWEKCYLYEPPPDCLAGIQGAWVKESSEDFWTATTRGKYLKSQNDHL